MADVMADRREAPRYALILAAEVVEIANGAKLTARSSDVKPHRLLYRYAESRAHGCGSDGAITKRRCRFRSLSQSRIRLSRSGDGPALGLQRGAGEDGAAGSLAGGSGEKSVARHREMFEGTRIPLIETLPVNHTL